MSTELINFNDNLFQLVRIFPDHPNFPVEEGKEYLRCDTVLRKEGRLYFCRKIEDAQVIEETTHE